MRGDPGLFDVDERLKELDGSKNLAESTAF